MTHNKERMYDLRRGGYRWGIYPEKQLRGLSIFGVAETEAPNVIAVNIWTIAWRWPPVRHLVTFTDHPDYAPAEDQVEEGRHGHDN